MFGEPSNLTYEGLNYLESPAATPTFIRHLPISASSAPYKTIHTEIG